MNLTLSDINLVINETRRLNEIHAHEMEKSRIEHQNEIEELNLKFNRQLRDLTDIHHIVEETRDRERRVRLIELSRMMERKPTFFESLKGIIDYVWACIYCIAIALRIAKPIQN